jgi:hypothetical protein
MPRYCPKCGKKLGNDGYCKKCCGFTSLTTSFYDGQKEIKKELIPKKGVSNQVHPTPPVQSAIYETQEDIDEKLKQEMEYENIKSERFALLFQIVAIAFVVVPLLFQFVSSPQLDTDRVGTILGRFIFRLIIAIAAYFAYRRKHYIPSKRNNEKYNFLITKGPGGEWTCPYCRFENIGSDRCEQCGFPPSFAPPEASNKGESL